MSSSWDCLWGMRYLNIMYICSICNDEYFRNALALVKEKKRRKKWWLLSQHRLISQKWRHPTWRRRRRRKPLCRRNPIWRPRRRPRGELLRSRQSPCNNNNSFTITNNISINSKMNNSSPLIRSLSKTIFG